jgi:hypothetical protein
MRLTILDVMKALSDFFIVRTRTGLGGGRLLYGRGREIDPRVGRDGKVAESE